MPKIDNFSKFATYCKIFPVFFKDIYEYCARNSINKNEMRANTILYKLYQSANQGNINSSGLEAMMANPKNNYERVSDRISLLEGNLLEISENLYFKKYLADCSTRDLSPQWPMRLRNVSMDVLSIGDLLSTLTNLCRDFDDYVFNLYGDNGEVSATSVSLPKQLDDAYLRFKIDDKKLNIKKKISDPGDNEERAEGIRGRLLEIGSSLIDRLDTSNCDPLISKTVSDLHVMLIDDPRVVEPIGVENLYLQKVSGKTWDDIPDAVLFKITSYGIGIATYLAQFEDWSVYCKIASGMKFNDGDFKSLVASCKHLITFAEQNRDRVSFDLYKKIRSLSLVLDWMSAPDAESVYAMSSTIHNYVVSINEKLDKYIVNEDIPKSITIDDSLKIMTSVAVEIVNLAEGAISQLPHTAWLPGAARKMKILIGYE